MLSIDQEWNEDIYSFKIDIEQQDVKYDTLECQLQIETLKSGIAHFDLQAWTGWGLDLQQKWKFPYSFFEHARLVSMI